MVKSERKLKVEVKPISASLWNVTQIVAIARIEGVIADAIAKLEIIDGEYAGAFVLKKNQAITMFGWLKLLLVSIFVK